MHNHLNTAKLFSRALRHTAVSVVMRKHLCQPCLIRSTLFCFCLCGKISIGKQFRVTVSMKEKLFAHTEIWRAVILAALPPSDEQHSFVHRAPYTYRYKCVTRTSAQMTLSFYKFYYSERLTLMTTPSFDCRAKFDEFRFVSPAFES